jgi:uncharacterized protein (TIGR02271 family)
MCAVLLRDPFEAWQTILYPTHDWSCMAMTNDATTLVCLFHHQDQASAAVRDLSQQGFAQSAITILGADSPTDTTYQAFERLGIPERDKTHLQKGLRDGGTIVSVSASADQVSRVEKIFGDHSATKIDEASLGAPAPEPMATEAGEVAIPVVEETLEVGKRAVDRGGVRVYQRVVETPVQESVSLHEEHVTIQREPVNRPVTEADRAFAGDRAIELTETAEEAVVGKSARVVEEVVVGKRETDRTEHIQDSVRHTEVEVEEIGPASEFHTPREDV